VQKTVSHKEKRKRTAWKDGRALRREPRREPAATWKKEKNQGLRRSGHEEMKLKAAKTFCGVARGGKSVPQNQD